MPNSYPASRRLYTPLDLLATLSPFARLGLVLALLALFVAALLLGVVSVPDPAAAPLPPVFA